MIYTEKQGLKLSKIALGSASFGQSVDLKTSFLLMDAFYQRGGNFIDTARMYGTWQDNKMPVEDIVGEWISQRKLNGKIFIATKGGHPRLETMHISRLTKKDLESDMEESLKSLKVDCIDVYFLHRDDESVAVSEIMPILDGLVKQGKARRIGASNWTAKRIKEANDFANANGLTPFTFSQIMHGYAKVNFENLEDKSQIIMNDEEYEFYKNNQLTLMSCRSQNRGFFTLASERGIENLHKSYISLYDNEENRNKLKVLKEISLRIGVSPTAIGLAPLVLDENLDTIALIGPLDEAMLKDSCASLDIDKKYLSLL